MPQDLLSLLCSLFVLQIIKFNIRTKEFRQKSAPHDTAFEESLKIVLLFIHSVKMGNAIVNAH